MGIRRLDAVVLSHAHSDHLGGVPAILRSLEVAEVIDSDPNAHSALFQEYLRLVDSLHLKRTIIQEGSTIPFSSAIRCFVLHPPPHKVVETLNNQSLVLKVCFGHTALLLAGDAEWEAERRIAGRYATFMRAGLLKVPHHGSSTSSSPAMLDKVRPSLAIVSVGANNKFGHPSSHTLRRLTRYGCAFIRTDEHGAVIVESDGERWRCVDWHRP
jgi:competence protein ComEC